MSPSAALPVEAELILAAARPGIGPDDAGRVERLITAHAADLDWGRVVDQAYQHKVLPLLAHNFLDHHLYPSMTDQRLKFRHERLFRLVAEGNAARNEALLRELAVVLRALRAADVPVLVRKGPVLMQEVYGDTRTRHMNDLDLMFEPGDLPRAKDVLTELGYTKGNVSRNRRRLVPMPRAEAAYWALHVPNVVLRRPTSERFVDYFMIDICLNQFLPGGGYDLPAGGFAERARETVIVGVPALAFRQEDMLVDLCVHLYKEATTLYYIALGKDLSLSKFLDVAEFARVAPLDWDRFRRRCADLGIAAPVYFALHHADLLYPHVVPAEVLDDLRPDDISFLDQFGFADKDVHGWRTDFLSRLFDGGRAAEVPESRSML